MKIVSSLKPLTILIKNNIVEDTIVIKTLLSPIE